MGKHPFKAWLDRGGRSQAFACLRARQLGGSLSQGYLSEILRGKASPTLEILALLERVSAGRVRAHRMAAWHLSRVPPTVARAAAMPAADTDATP